MIGAAAAVGDDRSISAPEDLFKKIAGFSCLISSKGIGDQIITLYIKNITV